MTKGRRKASATDTSSYVPAARTGKHELSGNPDSQETDTPSVVVRVVDGRVALPPKSAVLAVLREGRRILREVGWSPGVFAVGAEGHAWWMSSSDIKAYSLVGAIQTAAFGGIAAYHARRLLSKYVGDLVQWEQHPLRKKREVMRLLERAIDELEDRPPRRGGWSITVHSKGGQ